MWRLMAALCLIGCIDHRPTADPAEVFDAGFDAEPDGVVDGRFDAQPEDARRPVDGRIDAAPRPPPPPPPPPMENDTGMTWRLNRRFDASEAVDVGCGDCDPYVGDTPCARSLPLLCFRPGDAPPPAGLPPADRYHEWSGGQVQRSAEAVSPVFDELAHIDDANARCAAEFGADWRLATFHDGWGWNFRAYGLLPDTAVGDRFWVHVHDQARGNCWAR